MQLKIDQLGAHLARGRLARCYVLSGDEALLLLEAQDAIRAAARAQGFAERHVLHAHARFDWGELDQAATGLSLFSQRQIIEIRLPTGKPGKPGSASLQAHARRNHEDTLTLISLPRLDYAGAKSDWAVALKAAGVWIDVEAIGRERLPQWISARLARQGQAANPDALEFLADQVEGNLLAAHQEIGKLLLLYGEGTLDLEQVRAAVFDVARFEGSSLPSAMLAGDPARIVRTLAGLQAGGEPLALLLWIVTEELRGLVRRKRGAGGGRTSGSGARGYGPGAASPALVEQALARMSPAQLAALLARCAPLDRLVKGLYVPDRDTDPWLELTELALGLQAAGAHSPGRWDS